MPRRRPPVLPPHRLRSRLAGWLRWVAEALEPAPPGLDLTGAPEFWAERVREANRQARAEKHAPWVLRWRWSTRPVRDNSQFSGHGDPSQTWPETQSASQQTTAGPGRHRRSMPGIAIPPVNEQDADGRSEAGRRRYLGVPLVRPRPTARPGPTGDELRQAAPVAAQAARPPDKSQARNSALPLLPKPATRPGPPGDERRQAAPVTAQAARPPNESQARNTTSPLRPKPAAWPRPPDDERLLDPTESRPPSNHIGVDFPPMVPPTQSPLAAALPGLRDPTSRLLEHVPGPAVLPGTLWPELPVRPAGVPTRQDSTLALLRYQRLAAEQAAT